MLTYQESVFKRYHNDKKFLRVFTYKMATKINGYGTKLRHCRPMCDEWRRQDFVTGGEVRYASIGGLEYEVPQSRLYCLCINVALCSTALKCICRVIRRSSTTMKAHTYYIIFGRRSTHRGGSFPPSPWRRHCVYRHNRTITGCRHA